MEPLKCCKTVSQAHFIAGGMVDTYSSYVYTTLHWFNHYFLVITKTFRMPDNLVVTDVSYPIHYSQVQCTGEENSILNCTIESTTTDCTHSSDAAIVCRINERGKIFK